MQMIDVCLCMCVVPLTQMFTQNNPTRQQGMRNNLNGNPPERHLLYPRKTIWRQNTHPKTNFNSFLIQKKTTRNRHKNDNNNNAYDAQPTNNPKVLFFH